MLIFSKRSASQDRQDQMRNGPIRAKSERDLSRVAKVQLHAPYFCSNESHELLEKRDLKAVLRSRHIFFTAPAPEHCLQLFFNLPNSCLIPFERSCSLFSSFFTTFSQIKSELLADSKSTSVLMSSLKFISLKHTLQILRYF